MCILDFWIAAPEAHLGEADKDVVGSHDVGQGQAAAFSEPKTLLLRIKRLHPRILDLTPQGPPWRSQHVPSSVI